MAGAVQETFPADMLIGQGADFLKGGSFLEQQTFRFAKTIFRGIDRQIDRYTDRYTDKQIDK